MKTYGISKTPRGMMEISEIKEMKNNTSKCPTSRSGNKPITTTKNTLRSEMSEEINNLSYGLKKQSKIEPCQKKASIEEKEKVGQLTNRKFQFNKLSENALSTKKIRINSQNNQAFSNKKNQIKHQSKFRQNQQNLSSRGNLQEKGKNQKMKKVAQQPSNNNNKKLILKELRKGIMKNENECKDQALKSELIIRKELFNLKREQKTKEVQNLPIKNINKEDENQQQFIQQYLVRPSLFHPSKNQNVKLEIRHFIIGEKILESEYSNIFKAKHISTNFLCSLRVINKNTIRQEMLIDQLSESIRIHSHLSHRKNIVPGINKIYGFFYDEFNIYTIEEFIFQNVNKVQNLEAKFKKSKKNCEEEASLFLKKISEIIKYMHDEQTMNRNLKMKYVVESFGMVKLVDFSFSAFLKANKQRQTFCGCSYLSPPEQIKGLPYDQSFDVWSLGILLYEMVTKEKPFQGRDQLQKIKNLQIHYNICWSNALASLIGKIFTQKQQRVSVDEVLDHEFLREAKDNEQIQKQIWQSWMSLR